MKRKIISIITVILLLMINTITYADVKKDETVYVKLKYDGSIDENRVVNHIYGSGTSDYYKDYGKYVSIRNLVGNTKPAVSGDEISWPMDLLKNGDIYYEGVIDKQVPVSIGIKYYLDGSEIQAGDIGGRSGHFKTEVSLKYNKAVDWEKTSLLAQVQMTLDMDVFSNITSDANRVVVGRKSTLTFVSFPPGSGVYSFEADGKDIYLEPISITVVPSAFSIPGNIKEGISALAGGLDKMKTGSNSLSSGAGDLAAGTLKFRDGIYQLDSGIGRLSAGAGELSRNSKDLNAGLLQYQAGLGEMMKQSSQMFNGFDQVSSGMEELSKNSSSMYDGIGKLSDGLSMVNSGTKGLSGGLDKIASGHNQLMMIAQMYKDSNDPYLRQLAQGIIDEGEGLNKINEGLKENSKGLDSIDKNTQELKAGFGEYKSGIEKMSGSLKQIQTGFAALPDAFKKLYESFDSLKTGLAAYFTGVDKISSGLLEVRENVRTLPKNADKIADGQISIKNGALELSSGISKMGNEIDKNINGSLLGKGENTYNSFADNTKNKNSTVQFIMRTPSIDKPEAVKTSTEANTQKRNFIERFLDLFRKS